MSALKANNSSFSLPEGKPEELQRQRQLVAGFCRLLSDNFLGKSPDKSADKSSPDPVSCPNQGIPAMAPRVRQTLELLLAGDSEKQIAAKLKLSQHTVHDYVKTVYRQFNVGTRAELLALWVKR